MNLLHVLPVINASLNGLSGILLLSGYTFIRQKRIQAHKRCMLAACATSTVFLICYVIYHVLGGMTRFAGRGWSRLVYFAILATHTPLAIAVVPLAIVTVLHGLNMRVPQHRRVAKWTFPLWMYVSVTGVLVYFFLYHWFPSR